MSHCLKHITQHIISIKSTCIYNTEFQRLNVGRLALKSISPHSRKRQCFLLPVGSLIDARILVRGQTTGYQIPTGTSVRLSVKYRTKDKCHKANNSYNLLFITFICIIFQITDNIFTILRRHETRFFIKQTRT